MFSGQLRRNPGTGLNGVGGVLLGLALCVLLHALLVVPMNHLVRPALAYVGLTQWLYLTPAAWLAGRAGYPMVRRGLLLGGASTLLLNAVAYSITYYLFFVPRG